MPVIIYQNYGNGNLKRLSEGNSGRPDGVGNFSIKMTIPPVAEAGIVTVGTLTGGGYAPEANFTVTPAPQPSLAVNKAFTTNGTTREQTAFHPGDAIWYVVSLDVKNGPARGAVVHWRTTGPREIYNYTSNPTDISTGYQAPYAPAKLPQDAPAGTYTLTADVTFSGSTTTRTSTFTIISASVGTAGNPNPNPQQPSPDLSGPSEEPPSAMLTPGNREVPQWLQNSVYCGLDVGFRVGWIARAAKASGVGAKDAQFLGYVNENGKWFAVLWDAAAKDYWSVPLEFVPYNSCVKLASNALFPNGIGELQPPGPGQPIPVPVGTPTPPK